MRILSARIFPKSFDGKIKHGQTDAIKETLREKIDKTLAYKICFLILQSFDFTEFNIVLASAIWK